MLCPISLLLLLWLCSSKIWLYLPLYRKFWCVMIIKMTTTTFSLSLKATTRTKKNSLREARENENKRMRNKQKRKPIKYWKYFLSSNISNLPMIGSIYTNIFLVLLQYFEIYVWNIQKLQFYDLQYFTIKLHCVSEVLEILRYCKKCIGFMMYTIVVLCDAVYI